MEKDDPVLRDRGYYRMLSDLELYEEAERQSNELALVLAERTTGKRIYGKELPWHTN